MSEPRALLFDAGNTRLKWGLLSQGRIGKTGSITHEKLHDTGFGALTSHLPRDVDRVLASNVAGQTFATRLSGVIGIHCGRDVHFVHAEAEAFGLTNGYRRPRRIGGGDQPAGNLFVFLEEVAEDGTAENVAFGRLALWNRKLVDAPYGNLGLPWHSGLSTDTLAVVPGEVYPVEVALMPTSRVFRAGSRIRLSVRGADPRQRNIEQIRRTPAETFTVYLGSETRIEIPALGPVRFTGDAGAAAAR